MAENQQGPQRMKEAEAGQKVVLEVTEHGGSCCSSNDSLLERMISQQEKVAALKAEILYHKTVRGYVSPHLQLTQPLPQLTASLKSSLDEQTPAFPRGNVAGVGLDVGTRDTKHNSTMEHKGGDTSVFTFSIPGQYVAVYYDDDFYIGSVDEISNEIPNVAKIRFLKRTSIDKNAYVWPDDRKYSVQSRFVFAWDFETKTTNSRTWTVNTAALEESYTSFKKRLLS